MAYKVKDVAEMSGISVRMLHHYDRITLLCPESKSPAGYRLYSEDDLEKLQQILFFRELDFPLEQIKTILNHPDFDKNHTLKKHYELLVKKKIRLESIITLLEKTINIAKGETKMSKEKMFQPFDMSEFEAHKSKYAEEAMQKYGSSDAYKESQNRTSQYTKEDWYRIMTRQGEIYKKIISLMDKGPENQEVQEAIAENRQFITENFYDCTVEIYRGLGELYVADPRFTHNIDKW